MAPILPSPEGVNPSLWLMPSSPFGRALLTALPSLAARRTLLLLWGETSGLLSRSAWVAGLLPLCFLFLATMVVRKPRFDSGRLLDQADGLTAVQPGRGSYLLLRSAPF